MKQITYERPGHLSLIKSITNQYLRVCDVGIKVNGQIFKVHKNVLTAGIPYFETIFSPNFQQSGMLMVPMNNITASNMEILIAFAYSGKITITDENIDSLIIDVDRLQLTDIKEECEKFLVSDLRVENVCKIYKLADASHCLSLKEELYKFMRLNIFDLVESKDFLDFDFSLFTEVLINNELRHTTFSPSELFGIIVKWLAHNFNHRKIHLWELMRCANFSAVTFENLYNHIFNHEVVAHFSEREHRDFVADIFQHQTFVKQEVKYDVVDTQPVERIAVVEPMNPTSIKIYDTCTGVWESISIDVQRHIQCAIVYEGRLYLYTDKVIRFYEFDNKTWGEVHARNMHNYCFLAGLDGYIYVCSLISRYCPIDWTQRFSRFNCMTQYWENLSSLNVDRLDAEIISFRNHIYSIGGQADSCTESNIVERYDPETNEWTIIPKMQNCRARCATAVLNEKIYVCGGCSNTSYYKSVEFYDPETNRWEYAAPMKEARSKFLVVALAGKLWALGGVNDKGKLSSIEAYDPVKNSWSLIPSEQQIVGHVFGGVLFN